MNFEIRGKINFNIHENYMEIIFVNPESTLSKQAWCTTVLKKT